MLGEEGYGRYKLFEETRRAEREKKHFLEYLNGRGTSLDPENQAQLVEAIKQSAAYMHTPSTGPFDPLPAPAVGKEMLNQRFTTEIAEIRDSSSVLLERLSTAGWSENQLSPVSDYYAKGIEERASMLSNIVNRSEDQRKSAAQVIQERRNQRKRQ